jgi:hypothetical protein
MNSTAAQNAILRGVMDRWKSAVDAHEPHQVASYFTEDAIFQGLHPYTAGRQGVAEYYDSQPLGLTADYQVLEIRQLAEDALLSYLDVPPPRGYAQVPEPPSQGHPPWRPYRKRPAGWP